MPCILKAGNHLEKMNRTLPAIAANRGRNGMKSHTRKIKEENNHKTYQPTNRSNVFIIKPHYGV
jgi:hypothetical protein